MPQFPSITDASGIWTLKKQKRAQQGSNWPLRTDPAYIEDVFSTWLYTGNGTSQTITNGVDLSGKGGMVWVKSRSSANDHAVMDTARGIATNGAWTLIPNGTFAQFDNNTVTAFNSSGFNLGSSAFGNSSGATYTSWTFRKQPKFFDVVTYTGTGSARTIAHNLGSVPGCIIVKSTNNTSNWLVYHRSTNQNNVLYLNQTAPSGFDTTWNLTAPTSTVFSVNGDSNNSGWTYVAYLFAHDAGGFGLTGMDNAISCGSYTGNGTSQQINLGWEPQWFLYKAANLSNNWQLADIMRGMPSTSAGRLLQPNLSGTENSGYITGPTATGINISGSAADVNQSGVTYIYIAIRRGPMRTPTSGTSVYSALAYNGDQTNNRILSQGTAGPADLFWFMNRNAGANTFSPTGLYSPIYDRLRRITVSNSSVGELCPAIATPFTDAEGNCYSFTLADTQTNFSVSGAQNQLNWTNSTVVQMFRRAPGFFDEVCYTGNDTAGRTVAHNLGVVPELIIVKCRTSAIRWAVYSATLGNTKGLVLNTNAAETTIGFWGNTTPTSTVFTVDGGSETNQSGNNYVSYLFASCPGVSKVGTYTGTGALQTINCGFTGGARFVLIKRTDSTGDWFVYDSARGITSGNDPYLLTNGTAAEVTGTNYVDTTSVGFQVTAAAPAGLNASGGTYIFLAIA